MIVLRWAAFPGSDVASYKLYRSIVGFVAPLATNLAGLTLLLRFDGGAPQTFTFTSGDPIALINATVTGGYAYPAGAGTKFMVRSNTRQAPGSVEIVGGTALSVLGLSARLIIQQSEDLLIAEVPAGSDPATLLEYDDPDGSLQDFYAITTLDSHGDESLKSNYQQPISATGPLCVIEGLLTDLQGVRIPDAEITARIERMPSKTSSLASVTKDTITVLSGPDGRFSLPLLQGMLIKLEVPCVGLSHMITVPALSFVLLNDLLVDLNYQYPPGYQG